MKTSPQVVCFEPEILTPKATIQSFKQSVKNSVINKTKSLKPIELSESKLKDTIINFIQAASTLRCQNFKLPFASRHKVEEQVFKIKPNLNVTATIASALATMELIKQVSVSFR